MKLAQVIPKEDGMLRVVSNDGRCGIFDVRPYMDSPAFQPLKDWNEFKRINNGKYFVEWACGADLSADTIEAHLTTDNT